MMTIAIAERLKPFSHTPGMRCLLPCSKLTVQVFPTLIRVEDQEIPLELTGPVKDFAVQVDLEKGCVWVWGTYREGYHRFKLWSDQGSFKMAQVRGQAKEKVNACSFLQKERLSLGSHKKQDWCLIKRRADLKEVFPHWHKMAQLLPDSIEEHSEGTAALLDTCQTVIDKRDRLAVYPAFLNLFQTGFEGILSPRLTDLDHLGMGVSSYHGKSSPLILLHRGAKLIRELFISESDHIEVLPCLPPQFHCGRFLDIDIVDRGSLDLEWSKKLVRRIVFRSRIDQELKFSFQKDIADFRLRTNSKGQGRVIEAGQQLTFEANHTYFFDRFHK